MIKDKHILVLPKWYPSPQYASAGIFVQRHIESVLSYTNISVLYAESNPSISGFQIIEHYGIEKEIPTYRYSFAKRITGFSFLDRLLKIILYFIALQKGFNRIKKEQGKIELIHVTVLLRTGIFAWIKKTFSNIPYIITEHWTGYLPLTNHYEKNTLKKLITPYIIKKAALISPASDDLGKAMKNHGLNNNYFTVHNVVNTDFFNPNYSRNNTIPKIISVAMLLDEHKNISGMLRSLKRIKEEGIQFEYHILGKGKDQEKLIQYATSLNLENEVHFLGLQPANKVAEHMQNSDLLLLFSNYENLPCVIVEAFASGIPVLATDVGGMKEMIRNNNLGELINAKDEDALFHSLKKMILNRSRYDQKYIATFAHENFGQEFIGNRIKEMYELVFNND